MATKRTMTRKIRFLLNVSFVTLHSCYPRTERLRARMRRGGEDEKDKSHEENRNSFRAPSMTTSASTSTSTSTVHETQLRLGVSTS
jgi:hypothetical protein